MKVYYLKKATGLESIHVVVSEINRCAVCEGLERVNVNVNVVIGNERLSFTGKIFEDEFLRCNGSDVAFLTLQNIYRSSEMNGSIPLLAIVFKYGFDRIKILDK